MFAPDFSGKLVQSGHAFDKNIDYSLRATTKQPPRSPERKRYDKTRPVGHILIERHGNERHLHGEKSPHSKRQGIHQTLQGQIWPSPAKHHHFELAQELHNVSKNLRLCYEELKNQKNGYMREIMRENERKDSDHLLAIEDLYQQLMKEMVHLQRLLSHHTIKNINHADIFEKPLNNPAVSDAPGPNDLVHLKGPITENTIITTLQARFNANIYHTKIGPVHVLVNPFNSLEVKDDVHQQSNNSLYMRSLITKSLEKLFEMQMPQMLILSGESGSGKSYTSQMLIKELMSCETAQTDIVKHVDASVTVLDSLVKAKTLKNAESSRMAILYEFHFNNQVIHKTKIRCIPLSMSRIVHSRDDETNFWIFYQFFAGLNPTDRAKLQLQTHSADELQYLYHYPSENQAEIEILRNQFKSWKSALQSLGIPFADVTRVLAAILLLGNVQFTEKSQRVLEVQGGDFELKAVTVLLGVSYTSLFRGLTKKTKLISNDMALQCCSATQANRNRDDLAKTLYLRMLSAIVRRCNCSRKLALSTEHNHSPSSSSESLTRSHDRFVENRSQAFGSNLEASEPVVSVTAHENVLGIADLFGFDNCKCNGMEQICTNLCSETIQHFYTTHIFKSAEGFCREEGIQNEVDVDYVDNSQCIELLTCQETGVLTHLDHETLNNGSTDDFVKKLRTKHADHQKYLTANCGSGEFGIAHHTAQVIYSGDELLRGNDDSIANDVIQMFSPEQCSFGFVVHLFTSDLKSIPEKDKSELNGAEGVDSFISSPMRTSSQEFQDKLDGLLKTLIHADPWFILCLKSSNNERPSNFDSEIIRNQVKALQIFETVHLLRSGYTHRMRLIPFAQRYFVQDDQLTQNEALEIAQSYKKMLNEGKEESPGKILYIGRKHVFFSEMLWQDLERSRPKRSRSEHLRRNTYQDVYSSERANGKEDIFPMSLQGELLQATYTPAENELTIPPAIPKRRGYTVIDNKKIAFPQVRVMIDDYRVTVNGQDVVFTCGESVKVTGASPKAGYLAVESRQKTGWVPYKLTRLMTEDAV